MGTDIIRTVLSDARELNQKLSDFSGFDYVLLDAPCSGLGVIRRKPDIKWTKTPEDVDRIVQLQESILEAVHALVKPGGVLVYSTCTLEPMENERMLERFLDKHPEFVPDASADELLPEGVALKSRVPGFPGMFRILPHYFGSDGFFMARMIKRG